MNPPSMESIFLILSGVILVAGILYWFWSHIQLTQKKVQLIENAMFELRSMVAGSGGPVTPPPTASSAAPPPSSPQPVYADLADDDWGGEEKEIEIPAPTMDQLTAKREAEREVPLEPAPEELQPGGRILVPTEKEENEQESTAEQFRELFVAPKSPESLDAMPVKELRRLAEQRGITGADGLRKKELLTALRQQIQPAATLEVDVTEEEATILE